LTDNLNGTFTYINENGLETTIAFPTDNFSGSFLDLTNVPTNLDIDSTDDFSGSFDDLTDIPADITDGDNDTTYSAGNGLNLSGTEFSINNAQLTPDFANLTNVPVNLDTDSADDFSGSFTDLTNVPTNLDIDSTDDFSGNYNDLIDIPAMQSLYANNGSLSSNRTLDGNGNRLDFTNINGGLNIAGATTGTGNINTTDGALVHIKQAATWSGLTPWALYVEGYTNLNGFRINGGDNPRGIFTEGNQLGFAIRDDKLITFTQNNNDTRLSILPGGILQFHEYGTGTITGSETQLLGVESNGRVVEVDLSSVSSVTGTEGSIFYADSDGTTTENNTDLFWDATNNRLGIGTNSPTHKMQVSGQVRATSFANANGTSGNPSYRFNSDSDTGMYRAATNQLAFSTNGIEAVLIDASQNIGIGTTSPSHKLHVAGNVRSNRSLSNNGSEDTPSFTFTNDRDTGIYRAAEDEIAISTGGQEALRIDRLKNVGIGIATPNSTLHANGSLATAIIKTIGNISLNATHHTVILGGNHSVTLPTASTSTGRMYIIKNPNGSTVSTSSYLDESGSSKNELKSNSIIWLQSDGSDWQLINNISSSNNTSAGNNGNGITGTPTNAITADHMDDGQNGTANNFTLNIRNTTGAPIDYEVLIENTPYATISGLVLNNHTYQAIDNGDGTYNHIFTSTSSLGSFASISITGGNNIQPPGSGLSCRCVSFYEL